MNDPDLLEEFLVESHENLDHLDGDLVELEKDPKDRERLGRIFRTIHTIKGTCGFLELPRLEAVAHRGESLLSRLRDGDLPLTVEITSGLLALVDAIRAMLARIESTGTDGDDDHAALMATLARLQDASSATTADPSPVEAGPAETGAAEDARSPVSESNVRVDVGLLDKLMDLVGELVLARNQVLQCGAERMDSVFHGTSQRLNLITTELQAGVMKTRMQPIGNVWKKLPRLTRALALGCGKQVRIVLDGHETELDRTIVESIKDPLIHLVRNAVDHGIETPRTRLAAGKPAEGLLSLRAFHEGGQVNIEIADDGAGIDPERLRRKATERGLIAPEQAAALSDREALQLIFWPGFSTADKVTNVSGRGVGMDVVKTNVEKIGGTVDVQSQLGEGTTVRVKIPLTLAIIPALIVSCGGDRYAIPQVSLLELVRLEGDQAGGAIERIHGTPVYRLRGRLLPIVYLDETLQAPRDGAGSATGAVNIVVLQAGDRQFGLVVEKVNDTQEIVVKPLGKHLKGLRLYAGATLMGDGKVALILDVLGLAQHAGVVIIEGRNRLPAESSIKLETGLDSHQPFLLLGLGRDHRLAIPLAQVTRLEKFPTGAVERTADHEVVQHRGRILPLIRLSDVFPGQASEHAPSSDYLQVIVHTDCDKSIGLVVDRIIDTVEASPHVQRSSQRPGIIGSAVIQERVTDVLDLPAIIRSASPWFFEGVAAL